MSSLLRINSWERTTQGLRLQKRMDWIIYSRTLMMEKIGWKNLLEEMECRLMKRMTISRATNMSNLAIQLKWRWKNTSHLSEKSSNSPLNCKEQWLEILRNLTMRLIKINNSNLRSGRCNWSSCAHPAVIEFLLFLCGLQNLEAAHQCVVDAHHCSTVVELAAVVRSREERD